MNLRIHSSEICAVIMILSLLAPAAVTSGSTVAWWRFEEGTPGGSANGSPGSIVDNLGGHNGTAVGGPVYRPVEILLSSGETSYLGLSFDGVDDRVCIPDSQAFWLTNNLTLEAIINFQGIPAENAGFPSQIIFRGDDRPCYDPYQLAVQADSKVQFQINSISGDCQSATGRIWITSPDPIPTNQTLHIAGTLDGATGAMKLFVNGVVVASTNTTIRPSGALSGPNAGLGIGGLQSSFTNESFRGVIHEVRVSDTPLQPLQMLLTGPGISLTGAILFGTDSDGSRLPVADPV